MRSLREQSRATAGVTFDQMLETIRYEGAYPTRERAETVTHAVLAALGRQLSEDGRAGLAACLPAEAALTLTAQVRDPGPLTGWGFVKDLAVRTGGTPATARWDAGAVLAPVARLAGSGPLDRILAELPSGYALLFGRAELVQAA
ncbi:MAG TPA: DUF2267 domain-containing protein [Streptomyces sp.]|uniref:DUF2267 domain-containing protein n=1 Tax=Streptomyces sp. TaxID=1931 RepID=UPI002CD407D5|nr:DUF2267 domain-containing protein [Streptomyces sp.]HWU07826.1 DUF2267 domain-containing protein [Streptomyces sp.]